ncbi:MAG: hypothetical protein BWX98_02400 [Candidatus Aminicenantes bacterium ADurb.Bin147]|nr:MAG: hypothetical protein BWX98_02400 [Candidatus Aminicenantes bacterium ADurb.Bin147]
MHAADADRGEVVVEMAEVDLRVRHDAALEHAVDDFALDLERLLGHVHELAKAGLVLLGRLADVADAVEVDRDDADRSGRVARSPHVARPAHELALVEIEAAAHRPDVPGIHVRPDVILEIGNAVLGRHVEQQPGVGGVPVEIPSQVVRRDGEGENPALVVTVDHELEKSLVDHVHLGLELAVGEVHFPAADDGLFRSQVGRDGPVEGQVGERRLPAPAGGDIQPVDELLDVLADLPEAELVGPDERGQQRVDAGEGLGPGELALHRPDVVDHVEGGRLQVLGRGGMDLVGDVAEALTEKVFERPAGAVADNRIGQVVDVEVPLQVGLLDVLAVDLVEGEVAEDLARDPGVEPGEAQGSLVGVFPDLPVVLVNVIPDQALEVDSRLLGFPDALVALPVEDIGLGDLEVSPLHQDMLNHVLDLLDRGDRVAAELVLQDERHDIRDCFGLGVVIDSLRFHGLEDRVGDLVLGEINNFPVPLLDPGDDS